MYTPQSFTNEDKSYLTMNLCERSSDLFEFLFGFQLPSRLRFRGSVPRFSKSLLSEFFWAVDPAVL